MPKIKFKDDANLFQIIDFHIYVFLTNQIEVGLGAE